MVDLEQMAPSPRQPLNRRGVRRISGFGRTNTLTNGNSNGQQANRRKHQISLRMATINVATERDKEEELVEVMRVRKLDLLALAETRLKGCGDKVIHDDYRMIFSGREDGRHGVALILGPQTSQFCCRHTTNE